LQRTAQIVSRNIRLEVVLKIVESLKGGLNNQDITGCKIVKLTQLFVGIRKPGSQSTDIYFISGYTLVGAWKTFSSSIVSSGTSSTLIS